MTDHAGPFGHQSWFLLLLSAGPAQGLNTLFFTEIRSRRNTDGTGDAYETHLSHLGAAQPQKSQQKYCHYNLFLTSTHFPVGERGGRRGADRRVGWGALLRPTSWGGKGQPLSSRGDACHPCGDLGAGFLSSPTLPPRIAHQSAQTFRQITQHPVKT